ncbi:MAG: aminotransferase class IV [Deltaproteobacteria bacterium]|jgi:4-amino-4-deoxychorismate lyase|nr:aminotransferase class IV [Deltaproteobacteria bacterium]
MTKENIFLETLKIDGGKIHLLELHKRRMARTCREFFGSGPNFELGPALPDPGRLRGRHKLRVAYGLELVKIETEPYKFREIDSLEIVAADGLDYSHKFLDRGELEALRKNSPADDVVISQNGFLTDSSFANLVFQNEEGLFTPEKCLLPGVKRESLLALGLITARPIRVSELNLYRRVRLINAMTDLEDDRGVDVGKIFGPTGG